MSCQIANCFFDQPFETGGNTGYNSIFCHNKNVKRVQIAHILDIQSNYKAKYCIISTFCFQPRFPLIWSQ